jgi:RNA polymerase sigma factor (sigma-70 family)
MEDPEVVAAIVAGDPAGLAEAYDKYAVPLHSYCRSMLREPADAADAVQDTFLVATAKLHSLRDPGKLRVWLYAVARNECLRRLRARNAVSALEEAVDLPTQTGEVGIATERAELQELVRAAINGLNPGERDVIELSLVAELDGNDLAAALGVSRNHAHAQLSRARSQLERSLGALIVARTGRMACPDLDAMLTGWDGQLTVLMRKRISRHIERCEVCGERKRRELTPALFAGAMPLVALLPGFRQQLLRMLADRSPAGLAHRLTVANRAGPFGPDGFPKPIRPPAAGPWRRVRHHPHAVLAGTAASVVVAGVIAVAVIAGSHHGPPPAGAAGGSTHGGSVSTASPSSARGGPSGRDGNGPAPSASTPDGTTTPDAFRSPRAPGAPGSAAAATNPTLAAGSSSSSAPSSSEPSESASAGTLSVSTSQLDLVSVNATATGRFTLTAQGGPVTGYSITVGSTLAGDITVSPSSGSLAPGTSVTITVTSTSLVAVNGQLTVNPGGQTITVLLGIGL